jgi:hypothetical protein
MSTALSVGGGGASSGAGFRILFFSGSGAIAGAGDGGHVGEEEAVLGDREEDR